MPPTKTARSFEERPHRPWPRPSISPSATATPSADAPREYAIEPYALFVTVLFPRTDGRFDAIAGQERTLDLYEMYILWIDDGSIRHGGYDSLCRFPRFARRDRVPRAGNLGCTPIPMLRRFPEMPSD